MLVVMGLVRICVFCEKGTLCGTVGGRTQASTDLHIGKKVKEYYESFKKSNYIKMFIMNINFLLL